MLHIPLSRTRNSCPLQEWLNRWKRGYLGDSREGRPGWTPRCVYLCVLQRYTRSQKNLQLVLLFSLVTMNIFARSSKPAHPAHRAHHAYRHSKGNSVVSTDSQGQTFSNTRRLAIQQYFQDCACPAARWAHTFVQEADRQGLDWRLVASISMIESTGGKHYKNRNILGWKSALQRFRSEQAGIAYVSERLHNSSYYAGKSLGQMLRTYNSERRNYVALVTGVMQQLAAIEDRLRGQQTKLAFNHATPLQPESKSVAAEPVLN
jgi:hypothetical protein